jgi:CheY-like chemotaxis protein
VAGLQDDTLDGYELSTALHANQATRNMRIILTSADAGPRLARKAAECGAHTLVRKGSLADVALANVLRELG